jgi:LEA14-like dessication related protein
LNTALKIGLFAAIGLLVWDYAKKALNQFKVDVSGYGKPTLKGYALTVPLQLRFKNPTPVPISVDRFLADVYVWKGNQYVKGAIINQSLTIQPGTSESTIYPQVQLDQLFGGDLIATASLITNIIQTKQINIRVDYSAIVKGIALPTNSFTQALPL